MKLKFSNNTVLMIVVLISFLLGITCANLLSKNFTKNNPKSPIIFRGEIDDDIKIIGDYYLIPQSNFTEAEQDESNFYPIFLMNIEEEGVITISKTDLFFQNNEYVPYVFDKER